MNDHNDHKKEKKPNKSSFFDMMKKKEVDEDKKHIELEKGDFLAMVIAFSMYAIPLLIGVLLLFFLVSWLLFGL